MKCPYCQHPENQVIETRETENIDVTRRRRECGKCHKRFTTYERIDATDIIIVKKDKRREPFDRKKLADGIMRACVKRPVSLKEIDELIDSIEADLRRRDSVEVTSKTLGKIAMRHLKKVDKIAYIRFSSVYEDYEEIDKFIEALEKLQRK